MSIAWLLYESYQRLLAAEQARLAYEQLRPAKSPVETADAAADDESGGRDSGACT